uniref:Glycosyl hydrolase n=1 Tax=Roseihalotalea indica TaxID=2867963 RepID=A0AA49GTF4_9BACT|nr:glycosyl hydrolase [Tunicatimonas sp. TK19036]
MKLQPKLLLVYFLLIAVPGIAQDSLLPDFQNPPNTAKPRVWWHWMNGNISQDGIRKDLEWMKRTGIGGFQNFDANLFTPLVMEKKIEYMQPDWKAAFQFATKLADSLELEMAIAGSPGWSVTGGPWVEPKDGMKKYVWTETLVTGGQTFRGAIPQPSEATGHFQNIALPETTLLGESHGELPTYYHDAAVIAYRVPDTEKLLAELNPTITSSGGNFTLEALTDGDLNTTTYLPPEEVDEEMWIQFEFENPQTFKAFSIVGANEVPLQEFNGGPENRALQVSDDGVNFKEIARVPGSIVPQNTISIPPTTAKYFRFTFTTLPPASSPFAAMFGGSSEPAEPDGVPVAEIVLHTTDRIDQFESKAGFIPWKENEVASSSSAEDAVPTEDVIDLSAQMQPDGSLEWDAPDGKWRIVRLGYSLTGRQNHPASPEATGLEVDKLDADAVTSYINTYLDMYKDATGGMMGEEGLGYMILDSYEAGHMTWTEDMFSEFSVRRGYDMKPFVPVLTGRVIQSSEASEQFLWDFRKTIGEMIAENHYDVIGEELHKRDMKRYTESHENKRIYLADGMDVKRNADIPMSAMWTPGSLAGGEDEEVRSKADIRESASVANIYGQEFVAAESMTSVGNAFSYHPAKLKRTADMELASGLNRFVIHTSVHQPLDDKMPGFSLGPFGQYFTRQETWAEQAKPWIDYLARSCHMLQQGSNVADVLYYYGENHNITSRFADQLPPVPAGYEFDFVNASALIDAIEVKDGQFVAPSGNTYPLLVLDESARLMTLPVLKKLKELVDAGGKVSGMKPEESPSLADDSEEFQTLVDEVWQNSNVLKGDVGAALNALNLAEDVLVSNADFEVLYRHRKTPEQDIYWLNNRSESPTSAEVSFRMSGKVPKLWHPQTGEVSEVSYTIESDRTTVLLDMAPWDAFFVVFGEEALANSYTVPEMEEQELLTLTDPWAVSFQAERGAPLQSTFDKLESWTEKEEEGIKYFSGTATYQTTFQAPEVSAEAELILDLGEVKNLAEVILNGQSLGVIWKKPYRVQLNSALQPGQNTLQVMVTNVWVNRLIGDAQPGVEEKITFTTMPFYQADAELLPSGLLGPVVLIQKGYPVESRK